MLRNLEICSRLANLSVLKQILANFSVLEQNFNENVTFPWKKCRFSLKYELLRPIWVAFFAILTPPEVPQDPLFTTGDTPK